MSASRQVGAERSCGVRDGSADNGWHRHFIPANGDGVGAEGSEKVRPGLPSRIKWQRVRLRPTGFGAPALRKRRFRRLAEGENLERNLLYRSLKALSLGREDQANCFSVQKKFGTTFVDAGTAWRVVRWPAQALRNTGTNPALSIANPYRPERSTPRKDDVLVGHLVAGVGVDLQILDPMARGPIELVEGDLFAFRGRRVERDGTGDERQVTKPGAALCRGRLSWPAWDV